MQEQKPFHTLKYTFGFPNGQQQEFTVQLEKDSLHLVSMSRPSRPPEWTRLETFRCPHCPLDAARYTHCPVAVNLTELLSFFRDHISHEEVDLQIVTDERTYQKHTSLQGAVSSLLGIYMVSSGCPIMGKLKPMVRFHLPFATLEETKYRAISMYLVAQYLLAQQGRTPDWTLQGLVKIYDDVRVVNQNFAARLNELKVKDTSLNAISILSSFAEFTSMSIDYGMLEELQMLFDAYLNAEPTGSPVG
jgi:hypothetical protein